MIKGDHIKLGNSLFRVLEIVGQSCGNQKGSKNLLASNVSNQVVPISINQESQLNQVNVKRVYLGRAGAQQ